VDRARIARLRAKTQNLREIRQKAAEISGIILAFE
jgi:hypothetical protein